MCVHASTWMIVLYTHEACSALAQGTLFSGTRMFPSICTEDFSAHFASDLKFQRRVSSWCKLS